MPCVLFSFPQRVIRKRTLEKQVFSGRLPDIAAKNQSSLCTFSRSTGTESPRGNMLNSITLFSLFTGTEKGGIIPISTYGRSLASIIIGLPDLGIKGLSIKKGLSIERLSLMGLSIKSLSLLCLSIKRLAIRSIQAIRSIPQSTPFSDMGTIPNPTG